MALLGKNRIPVTDAKGNSRHSIHWINTGNYTEPTARWLGIFRRSLSLKSSYPGLMSIPKERTYSPEQIVCEMSLLSAEQLLSETTLCTPKVIGAQMILGGEEGGSVGLIGVLADEESSSPFSDNTLDSNTLEPKSHLHKITASSEKPLSLAKRLAYLLQPPTDILVSPEGPLEWNGILYPFQVDGVKTLISHKALLLADDMGLGKTIQVVAALRILAIQHRMEQALIVVPLSLLVQWRKEIRNWAPELRISTVHGAAQERAWQWKAPAHIYLTTYDILRSDLTENPESPPRRKTWDVVILDEAQRIKNRDIELSKKCKQIPRKKAWVLTGTPLENKIDDLASIMEFLTPLENGQTPKRFYSDSQMLGEHKRIQLRRKKTDVLPELPPKITKQILLPLSNQQMANYRKAEEEGVLQLKELGETVRIQNVLELILRLKQICNFCPSTSQSAKIEDMKERLDTLVNEGHRALIFSQFTDNRFGVRAIADKLGDFNPLLYTGGFSSSKRAVAITKFKETLGHKALILSLKAGGQGLNLQEASYVFHFDRWWNPAVEHQATDRTHRMGQTLSVHVYKYICENTIEERINQILQEKQRLFEDVVDDVSMDLKEQLTGKELFGLFGLTPPARAEQPLRKTEALPVFSEMNGIEFERYVQNLLKKRGWLVETTPPTRDGGIDLIATKQDVVGGETTLYIQCKNYGNPVGVKVFRELQGVLLEKQRGIRGVVVCPNDFSTDALSFAKSRGLIPWGRKELFELSKTMDKPSDSL